MKELKDLVEISHYYGKNKDYVIAGGGNTSYKNDQHLWIKASGTTLADISEDGFAVLDRGKLKIISTKTYCNDSSIREQEIKEDLFKSSVFPEKGLRPSVETSLHEMIPYKFVVHTHPTFINALLCSRNAHEKIPELFNPAEMLYILYTDPGYILFKEVMQQLELHSIKFGTVPKIILLQNHGVFVSSDNIDDIKQIYDDLNKKIDTRIKERIIVEELAVSTKITKIVPAIRMLLSKENIKIATTRNNSLIANFYKSNETFNQVSVCFTPDNIVYCKARAIYIENTGSPEEIIAEFKVKSEQYRNNYGYDPKIILIKNIGLVAVEDNAVSSRNALDVFEDLMKISYYSNYFGGPKFMNDSEIAFIENWEVENYRRQVSKGSGKDGKVSQKIVIITGGAQGFGAGIAENMYDEKANIVIADINENIANEFVSNLNSKGGKNKAIAVKTDVSDTPSVQNLIYEAVKNFGGLDVFISNAGILRAGSLEEMRPETFELITKINYNGYFICVKYASEVLKLQARFKKDFFTDIIQINSKSGLKGSNKNFAYAGGKFGGIGLTQSFAMELIPFSIKVNSVCPGNFFDGPLWSDPENGLFRQYLDTGKVPGAKSIADVKKFYEDQVPTKRGCTVNDVMKAIYYVIDQEYETGQAIPVTGGQIMLK